MSYGDNILLERFVRAGDAGAFSELVQVHAGLVYGTCLRVLTDHNRAADATQETFFQLLKQAEDITGSVSAWLHRVATNKAIDMIRRDSSRKRREVQYVSEKAIDSNNWQEISPYVDEALIELDADIRHVLTEHFLSGRSMTAIAASLGVSQPTVSTKIKSGLAQLRGIFRRRGLLVAAAVLKVMLIENTAQAAPAAVLNELGKMAIVSGASAAATSTASAGAAAAGGVKAAAGAVLTAVKANVVTGVAIAAISTGVIVTYDHVLKRADRAEPSAASTQQSGSGTASSSRAASSEDEQWDGFWEEVEAEETATGSSTVVEGDDFTTQAQDTEKSNRTSEDGSDTWQEAAPAAVTAMAGASASAADDPNDNTEEEAGTIQGGGGYGGMGGGGFGGGRSRRTRSRRSE